MQPSYAQLAKDIVKIKILGRGLGDGGVGAVRAADGAADAEAALGKVDAVAADPADAVGLFPVDEVGVHAPLLDEVLHQPADLVVGKGGDHGGVHAEALVQAADDVIFAAALPGAEGAGGTDTALAGIEAQHDLAKAYGVKLAVFSRSQIQFHGMILPQLLASLTISRDFLQSSVISSHFRLSMRSAVTI